MSRRFHLDPRAPAPERPAPPPPPAPAVTPSAASRPLTPSAPPPTPLRAPPTAPLPPAGAEPTRSRKKAYLLIGAIVALVVAGGAIAVYAATELTYPNKYVLDDGDMPAGMSNAQMSRSELDDAGMRSNPGAVDPEQFRNDFQTDTDAEEVHAQVLQDSRGSRVVVLALKYPDEDSARSAAASEGRGVCSFFNGAALRDGDVLLILLPEGASATSVGSVVRALKAQVPELTQVCGPR